MITKCDNVVMISKCATENEDQNSFEDCFEAIWEALYTYPLAHSAVPKITVPKKKNGSETSKENTYTLCWWHEEEWVILHIFAFPPGVDATLLSF